MFAPSDQARLFALPLGVDFGQALLQGLRDRTKDLTPVEFAQCEIFVNTRRTQRRLKDLLIQDGAHLLPRIRLITDLALDPDVAHISLPAAPLQRRLELLQLVSRLIAAEPDLAPASSAYALTDSLARLLDEMQGEGVDPSTIANLDVSDKSGHWQRALKFITLAQTYLGEVDQAPDQETRQRLVVEHLTEKWAVDPPKHPILIAGSTGSRGATAMLMHAVAKLPNGAVIVPGFDFDQPDDVWSKLGNTQDHPQYRFKALMDSLDLSPGEVKNWTAASPPCPPRNRLISLALRPAPITDQWQTEGPSLTQLDQATSDLTLIEAASPREEAEAIALRLRHAIDEGLTAALITPDRMLSRQVAAALDRWNIIPDDSAGQPLPLSPPGRLLRHVDNLLGQRVTSKDLLVILKHPLCHSGGDRNKHLLWTHELELQLRRSGPPFPTETDLVDWAQKKEPVQPGKLEWAQWVGRILDLLNCASSASLPQFLATHINASEAICAGANATGSGELWAEAAGRKAKSVYETLKLHSDAVSEMSLLDYTALFHGVLGQAEVRNRDSGHPQVLIWGTLEARVQSADLIILGSLNEGIWPSAPPHDPWLNRQMRADAGMLLPDRQIGLSAHDFQQAVAGKQVWLTRAVRTADADTVASRWINRLTNLLDGLPDQNGPDLLKNMRKRGDKWCVMAAQISAPQAPVEPAKRPSPCPPVDARPKQLSVTQIKTLIRDPYAIYARKVLRLNALDPIDHQADALMRGNVFHAILEQFIKRDIAPDDPMAQDAFMETARDVLQSECPWPATRVLWLSRLERVSHWFLETEILRRAKGDPKAFESRGEITLDGIEFELRAYADRIDITPDQQAILYDYKTGTPPTPVQQRHFDKQLLLEAAMVERGAFKEIGAKRALGAQFIGLGGTPKLVDAPLKDSPADQVWQEFHKLIQAWNAKDRGYTARIAHMKDTDIGTYDHLSRFGEWDMSDAPTPEDLT
ncbi:double-strand break repair protein AddB [Aestuariibius sp. HNIBRBA575]|uniref:double-strand break repair protein AddB n=1 Tax=Aestuariibius sp. HNIBRBA575 TaxID=3233343 RepID=UPI0034A48E6C